MHLYYYYDYVHCYYDKYDVHFVTIIIKIIIIIITFIIVVGGGGVILLWMSLSGYSV